MEASLVGRSVGSYSDSLKVCASVQAPVSGTKVEQNRVRALLALGRSAHTDLKLTSAIINNENSNVRDGDNNKTSPTHLLLPIPPLPRAAILLYRSIGLSILRAANATRSWRPAVNI